MVSSIGAFLVAISANLCISQKQFIFWTLAESAQFESVITTIGAESGFPGIYGKTPRVGMTSSVGWPFLAIKDWGSSWRLVDNKYPPAGKLVISVPESM